jgi:NADPH:quinone reductase-like Zn-dependent oxidoreductase
MIVHPTLRTGNSRMLRPNLKDYMACSVNPIDAKVRRGVYDDYPDYYERVPRPYQIIGFDGAGTI